MRSTSLLFSSKVLTSNRAVQAEKLEHDTPVVSSTINRSLQWGSFFDHQQVFFETFKVIHLSFNAPHAAIGSIDCCAPRYSHRCELALDHGPQLQNVCNSSSPLITKWPLMKPIDNDVVAKLKKRVFVEPCLWRRGTLRDLIPNNVLDLQKLSRACRVMVMIKVRVRVIAKVGVEG